MEQQTTFKTFYRLIKLFGNKMILTLTVLFTAILAGLEITVSYSIKQLLDSSINKQFDVFRNLILFLIGITVLKMIFYYVRGLLAGKYSEEGIALIRQRLADHLLFLPVEELAKKHSGDLTSRMTNDMNMVREFTVGSLLTIIYQPLAAIGAFIYLLTLNWQLTIITTFGVPIVFKLSAMISKPISRYSKEVQEKLALVNQEAQETINGLEIIRSYGIKDVLTRRYNRYVDNSIEFGFKLVNRRRILVFLSIFTGFIPFFICFGIGGYWALNGQMTPGSLIAFITLLNPLTFPISKFPELLGEMKRQMVAAARIFEILDIRPERSGGEGFACKQDKPAITFKNVSFAYPAGEKKILNDINFQVMPGEKVALVGYSGSGKSTIFKLILGYYEEYTGEIQVFDQPTSKWDLSHLRNQINLVAQDTYLFPGTIEENIALGNLDASQEEIVQAAQAANAHEFITELRDGYQSDVGEFGDKLSGGQKQRISIARAVLKNASIFLLDEATSALDMEAEYLVQTALDHITQENYTSLIIGHRLSTIKNADRILVLDAGKIIESGTHEELLIQNGVYKSMYMRQLKQGPEGVEQEVAM